MFSKNKLKYNLYYNNIDSNEINLLSNVSYGNNLSLFSQSLMKSFKLLSKPIIVSSFHEVQYLLGNKITYFEKSINVGKDKMIVGFHDKFINDGKLLIIKEHFNPIYNSQIGKTKDIKKYINFNKKGNTITLFYYKKGEKNETILKQVQFKLHRVNDFITIISLNKFLNELYYDLFIEKNIFNTNEIESYYKNEYNGDGLEFVDSVRILKNSKRRIAQRLLNLKIASSELSLREKITNIDYIITYLKLNFLMYIKEIKILFI